MSSFDADFNGDETASRAQHDYPVPRCLGRWWVQTQREIAPPHSISLSAAASTIGGISSPSAFAVLRLIPARTRWLLDRNIGRLPSPQNFVDIFDGATKEAGDIDGFTARPISPDRAYRLRKCGFRAIMPQELDTASPRGHLNEGAAGRGR
jgi:hypothetical protein